MAKINKEDMQMNIDKKWFPAALLCVLMLFAGLKAPGQPKLIADTGKVFTLSDLQELVFRYHPVVKQAGLLSENARANVLQSLGYFDPTLKAGFGQKVFGNTDYYSNWNSELKVPLWLGGADLKIGYDRSVGTYTNPETRTGMPGLSGVGLSIPLGQGLIIDARRNTLRQAQVMVQYAEAERVKQINATWYEIAKDYWEWYYAYRQYQLINEGVQLAQRRFEAVARQTAIGDKPPIDSVEAYITVQERIIQQAKMVVELQNARLVLSNHLWNEQGVPMELPADALPQDMPETVIKPNKLALDSLVGQAEALHPELVKLRTKGAQLAIERSYRQEVLKPKLNLSGTLISSRTSFNASVPDYYDFNRNNYKFGFDFAFPLFLRSERGKLREVKLKQLDNQYELQQTGREVKTSVLSAYNNLTAYADQLSVQVQSIAGQQTLLKGETQKFELGESTLFLINSRETKLIDMRIKRESMIVGYQKTLAELYYKAGTIQTF